MKLYHLAWPLAMLGHTVLAAPQPARAAGPDTRPGKINFMDAVKNFNYTELVELNNAMANQPGGPSRQISFNISSPSTAGESKKCIKPNKCRDEGQWMTVTMFGERQHVGQWWGAELQRRIKDSIFDPQLAINKGLQISREGKGVATGNLNIGISGYPIIQNEAVGRILVETVAYAWHIVSETPKNCYDIELRNGKFHWCQVPKYIQVEFMVWPDGLSRARAHGWLQAHIISSVGKTPPNHWSCSHETVEKPILDYLRIITKPELEKANHDLSGFPPGSFRTEIGHHHVDCEEEE